MINLRPSRPGERKIRPAAAEDHVALCDLWSQGDRTHARLRPDFFATPGGLARPARHLQRIIDDPAQALLVLAGEGGAIMGLVHVKVFDSPPDPQSVQTRRGHVEDLVVDEHHRRSGGGRALMEAAADWCAARGATKLVLTVWSGNQAALDLYRSLGYQPVCQVLGKTLVPAGPGGQLERAE